MDREPLPRAALLAKATTGETGNSDFHSRERLAHLIQVAHRECYIANSLTCEVTVEPTFRLLDYAFGDNEIVRKRLAILTQVLASAAARSSSSSLPAGHASPSISVLGLMRPLGWSLRPPGLITQWGWPPRPRSSPPHGQNTLLLGWSSSSTM